MQLFPQLRNDLRRPGKKLLLSGNRIDVDATTGPIESHVAIDQGENGVVAAKADVLARHELGPALANNDIACNDGFAAKSLNAESLAYAVATVLYAALSFFMCHLIEKSLIPRDCPAED